MDNPEKVRGSSFTVTVNALYSGTEFSSRASPKFSVSTSPRTDPPIRDGGVVSIPSIATEPSGMAGAARPARFCIGFEFSPVGGV